MTKREQLLTSPTHILRPATENDIAAIMVFERIPEFHTMVGNWSQEEHLQTMRDPDARYFLALDTDRQPAGFAILRGIQSPHHNVELKRFVIANPGHGLGQRALCAVMDFVFHELHAHRLWLDVFETNDRAYHVYRKAGFREDGIFREAVFRDGEFHTLRLMSILDREYFDRPGAAT